MASLPTIAVVSLVLYALFSAMELAFMRSNKLQLELGRKAGELQSRVVGLLLRKPSSYMATMLVGSSLSLTLFAISFGILLYQPIGSAIGSLVPIFLLEAAIIACMLAIAELIAKSICRINPNRAMRLLTLPAFACYLILYPLAQPLSWLARIGFKIRQKRTGQPYTFPFEKFDLLRVANQVGVQQQGGKKQTQGVDMFKNALEFSHLKVEDCMIPRTDVKALEINSELTSLKQLFIDSGLSRVLIYEENFDNIVGYVHSKDLFSKETNIKHLLRPIDFISENMTAQKLLAYFIKNQKTVAVVVDEFGGMAGLLTVEDILEEITGDIDDEHDSTRLVNKRLAENHFILSGRIEVEELNERYELGIPESEDYETLAGYIIYHHEKLPKAKEEVVVGNFTFKILRLESNRIELVDLKINEKLADID